jgi:hypothetical protein
MEAKMKRALLLPFVLLLSLSLCAQGTPLPVAVKPAAPSQRAKKLSNWEYYQGPSKILEADFLKVVGQPDAASLSAKYHSQRELGKAMPILFSVGGVVMILIGFLTTLSAADTVTTGTTVHDIEEADKKSQESSTMMLAGAATMLVGSIWGVSESKKPDNYLQLEQANAYADSYNASLSSEAPDASGLSALSDGSDPVE